MGSVLFFYLFAVRLPYCYTYRLLCAGATQGELPEGQREGPLGDTRVAQLVCSVVMDGICGFCLITDDTVGCDLGAPLVTHLHLA